MKFVLVDTSVWSLAFRKKRLDGNDKNFSIFALDKDFEQYRRYIDIELVNTIGRYTE
ncbi:hypothetical protein [Treponema sp. OMZ 838]|uniref:hypothetical protein n=1 Tax=Treponema sp. OMZ 838 TaxID=1539298 RepID=UPI000B1E633A|nr:hypothetical protein [Treponema sp. OMZ 838]